MAEQLNVEDINEDKDIFIEHGKISKDKFSSIIESRGLNKETVVNNTKEIYDFEDFSTTMEQLEAEKGADEIKECFINNGYITRQSILSYLNNQSNALKEAEIHAIIGNKKILKYSYKKFLSIITCIHMREVFKMVDKDGSGFITLIEMMNYLKSNTGQKWSFQEVSQKMMKADLNGDGRISFEEFVKMIHDENCTKDRMIESFKEFDLDGDGVVTKEELKEILFKMDESFNEEDIDGLMKSADKNGDNTINFEEFIEMIDWDN